jgi:hypothetical protein
MEINDSKLRFPRKRGYEPFNATPHPLIFHLFALRNNSSASFQLPGIGSGQTPFSLKSKSSEIEKRVKKSLFNLEPEKTLLKWQNESFYLG